MECYDQVIRVFLKSTRGELLVFSLDCQFDGIENHVGDKLTGVSVGTLIEGLNGRETAHLNVGAGWQ